MDRQKGFTLIELAIALMVIGLLIGGVLKGQELIENARITQTVRDIKSIETASMIFRSTYGGVPGDILNPSSRLPNCTASPCSVSGDKNGQINAVVPLQEPRNFFIHLARGGMLSNVPPELDTIAGTSIEAWLPAFPTTPMGGVYTVHYISDGSLPAPHTQIIDNVIQIFPAGIATITDPLTAAQAARIDRKIDDGKPYAGDVRGRALAGGDCGNASTLEYRETETAARCSVYVKTPL